MSTDQGWEKWYWRDWFSDPDVQTLSAAGRCGWFELLGWMWLNETDRWEGSRRTLRRLLRMDSAEFETFIEDMIESDVAEVTVGCPSGSLEGSNECITLLSRRRHRDVERNTRSRESNRLRQQRHREKLERNAHVTETKRENNGTESESESEKETEGNSTAPPKRRDPDKIDLTNTPGGHASQPPLPLNGGGGLGTATDLIAFLNERYRARYQAKRPDGSPTKTAELAMALLKHGYTPGQIRQVTVNRWYRWHDDDEMRKNLRPSTVWRLSNFDNYLGELDYDDE